MLLTLLKWPALLKISRTICRTLMGCRFSFMTESNLRAFARDSICTKVSFGHLSRTFIRSQITRPFKFASSSLFFSSNFHLYYYMSANFSYSTTSTQPSEFFAMLIFAREKRISRLKYTSRSSSNKYLSR